MRNVPTLLRLGHVNHLCFSEMGKELEKTGISRGQPFILDYLYERESCIQRELAQRWHKNPASITSVLNTMEAAGYIVRSPIEGDRRAYSVRLTELGRQKHEELRVIGERFDGICFAGFDVQERAALERMLEKIEANVKRLDERAE